MPVCRRIIVLTYATGLPLILLAFLFSGSVLELFTPDTAVVRTAFYPFCIMLSTFILSTFILSVPAYTYCNTIIGTGNTKTAFMFQIVNIVIYLFYLYLLSGISSLPLAVYWTTEQLYVMVLFVLSYGYLKRGKWTAYS